MGVADNKIHVTLAVTASKHTECAVWIPSGGVPKPPGHSYLLSELRPEVGVACILIRAVLKADLRSHGHERERETRQEERRRGNVFAFVRLASAPTRTQTMPADTADVQE